MASILAHAAIPLVTRRLVAAPGLERRLTVAAAVCAVWPDADWVTLAFEVRPADLLGHRGLTHSLPVAAAVAAAVALAGFRSLGVRSRAFLRVLAFLFAAAASHGALDAVTSAPWGVALLAPLTSARFAPLELLPSCPGGLDEALGAFGALTLANELLWVVVPLALAVGLATEPARRRRLAAVSGVWAILAVSLRLFAPAWFAPRVPRALEPLDAADLAPLGELREREPSGGALVTRLPELRALGLLDRELAPAVPAWSSSFFPSWFGAEGGRWMDGAPRLTWRTLFRTAPPTEAQARAWLAAAAAGDAAAERALFRLAPTEKIDLALGHLDFPATRDAQAYTHNAAPRPRYWYGRCAGVAAAATRVPEPFRAVDVVGKDGSRVRFHPNDVKALLALAYNRPERYAILGRECTTVAFDEGAACSMNPAALVVALTDRLGRARESLVLDAVPGPANQYYAVASARVRVGPERPAGGARAAPALAGRVRAIADADFDVVLSSTTLAYARADVRDAADPSGTRWARVGVVPVPMRWRATLALGDGGELLGGAWTGHPPEGPDAAVLVGDRPALAEDGSLARAPDVPWPLLRELARASAGDGAATPVLDLRTGCDGRCVAP